VYYIFTVGLSLSGKTWLINKIKKRYPRKFEVIETKAIHDYLNTMDIWKDDNTVHGESYELRQEATKVIRDSLVKVFSKREINLIQDSCNLLARDRAERLKSVKKIARKARSILIYVNPERKVIEGRAKREDAKLLKEGDRAAWHDLYLKQVEHFEKPGKKEANYFIEYDGKDWQSVIKKLERIVRP
jgi:hypothetical protein